ncbi:MAG: DUF4827 family protein [Muribaculaceae bacterium]|nr:DUF4827 family protein [Muribaculaceae bacterium]
MNKRHILYLVAAVALVMGLSACKDSKSYADLLRQETVYVNNFLADQRVENSIPADSVFEVGENAPYYMLDKEGNVYMQVLDPGDLTFRPEKDDRVYFRFTAYPLNTYQTGVPLEGEGNADDISGGNGVGAQFFLFNDYTNTNSATFGEGIQAPMFFLGVNAKVNVVIKSQFGWAAMIANVIPYVYNVRYYSSPLSPWKSELEVIE